jgi:phosphatidate phosphatase PAH1
MDFYYANAHEFKFDTIEKYVTQPFLTIGANIKNIFYAGFGNTVYDMHAYHNAGIDLHRMFLIDKKSNIYCLDSTHTFSSSTNECNEKIDKKYIQCALDHPKQYALTKGTLFVHGYVDPKLLTYILNLNKG